MPWDSTIPTGSTLISASDELLQANFQAIERGNVTNVRKVPVYSRDSLGLSSDPTNAANVGYLYGKDVDSKVELHFIDEDGNVTQLTNVGTAPTGLLQMQSDVSTAVQTITTAMTVDSSIPQNTEGDEVQTVTITPESDSSKLVIEFECIFFWGGFTGTATIVAALFQDSTADALQTVVEPVHSSPTQDRGTIRLRYIMDSTATTPTTFKIRMGPNGGNLYVNRNASINPAFGGAASSILSVTEII